MKKVKHHQARESHQSPERQRGNGLPSPLTKGVLRGVRQFQRRVDNIQSPERKRGVYTSPKRERGIYPFPNRDRKGADTLAVRPWRTSKRTPDPKRTWPAKPDLQFHIFRLSTFDFRRFFPHSQFSILNSQFTQTVAPLIKWRPTRAFVIFLTAATITLLTPAPARADDGFIDKWLNEISRQLATPLFWFGLIAQAMFFMRFFWQWLISEKRKQSTVPIVFWYFSLAGGICMFIYACLRPDLVIMLGQALACVIYIRNLMLIYQRADRRRRAGLPAEDLGSVVGDEDLPD